MRRLLPLSFLLLLLAPPAALADPPISAAFRRCSSGFARAPGENRINVSAVYAQLDHAQEGAQGRHVLRSLMIAETGETFTGSSVGTAVAATLLMDTQTLSFDLSSDKDYLCNVSLPSNSTSATSGCPVPAGTLALGHPLPLPLSAGDEHPYALATLTTRVLLLDSSEPPLELACVEFSATPYYPDGWYYELFFWVPVALAMAYFAIDAGARVGAALRKARGARARGWIGRERLETGVVGGVSGQMLGTTPSLLRFVTPSAKDIILHIQWCAVLAMIAVNWPEFAYPVLKQGAWSSLLYNVSLTTSTHVSPLTPSPFSPPAPFDILLSSTDAASPLYLNPTAPNTLLDLHGARDGIPSLAATVGLREQDAFGCCLAVALLIAAGVIVASLLAWAVDGVLMMLWRKGGRRDGGGVIGKDTESELGDWGAADGIRGGGGTGRRGWRRAWWEMRTGGATGGFHWVMLQGNLIRVLVLFHLPITILSTYQISLARSTATTASVALAALSLGIISVAIPLVLLYRVATTPTLKLYDATRTLLSLGPLYNVFRAGSQLFWAAIFVANLIEGITIGAVQGNGTAQAVVMLVVEIAVTLITSLWLPWGEGAQMGIITFILSVTRVITAALLVVLAPAVDIGPVAAGWVTYVLLGIQGLVFIGAFVILLTKLIEAFLRLAFRLPFVEGASTRESGLIGVVSQIGGGHHRRRRHARGRPGVARSESTSTQMMLDRHSNHNRLSSSMASAHFFPSSPQGGAAGAGPETGADDDYIMAAWRPEHGYSSPPRQAAQAQQPDSPSTGTGFSVVRGGRADFADPYAPIGSPSQRQSESTHVRVPSSPTSSLVAPPPLGSSADLYSQSSGSQLSQATSSRRARTRSFSAVIETIGGGSTEDVGGGGGMDDDDATTPTAATFQNPLLGAGAGAAGASAGSSSRPAAGDGRRASEGDSLDIAKPAEHARRKSWLGGMFSSSFASPAAAADSDDDLSPSASTVREKRKRNRFSFAGALGGGRRKTDDAPASSTAADSGTASGGDSGGSSFVVLRPQRPSPNASRSQSIATHTTATTPGSSAYVTPAQTPAAFSTQGEMAEREEWLAPPLPDLLPGARRP